MNTILSPEKAANSTVPIGCWESDFTQIGHGITDGALQGMDVSEAWKLASDSAVNYTPAALQPHVRPL